MNFAMSIVLSRTSVPHARLHRYERICRSDEQPGPAQTTFSVGDFFGRSRPSEPVPFVRYSNVSVSDLEGLCSTHCLLTAASGLTPARWGPRLPTCSPGRM